MTTIQPTDIGAVRHWIRQRQSAHRDRGSTAGNIYFALLFVAVVGGMLHRQMAVVFWPGRPNASVLAAFALVLTGLGGLFLTLRRLGPLGLSRPAASWLLTAPVSRRRLLTPSLRLATVAAAAAGAFFALAIVGHVAVRPMTGSLATSLLAGGALLGIVVLLAALATQAARVRVAAWADRLAGLLLAAGLAGFVVDSAIDAPKATTSWPGGPVTTGALILAGLVVVLLAVAVTRLARTPNERILDSSKTAGTLLDSTYGVEPSFVAEMLERRYWASRQLRSARLWGRVPVLVAQDLLLARRRPRRLLWTVGTIALPALLTTAPAWLLGAVVLIGGMLAAGASTANVKTDAGNPVLSRMLGLSSRESVTQRMWVPGVLATFWSTGALTTLQLLGDLPAGPWWALGLVLGPVGAAAAMRRARAGFVRNDMLAMDTQSGVSIATGPLLSVVAGPDVLLLGLPTLVQIAQGHPLSWTTVVVQAVVGVIGARAYLAGTTAHDRVELQSS
ncbi:DUF6297 family protein [Micromonosporaceae bacterium Da 78-11]